MKNRHLIEGAHVPRELFKGTGTNDGKIVPPESLGIWYVPLIWGLNEMNQLAKAMGGDQWKIMPKSFTGDHFQKKCVVDEYAMEATQEAMQEEIKEELEREAKRECVYSSDNVEWDHFQKKCVPR
jgi:hypothetical protein